MGAAGFVGLFVAIFVAILLGFGWTGENWKAAEERARRRRLTDARMNARLLRMDI